MKFAVTVVHADQAMADLKNAILFLERTPITGGEATALLNAITRIRTIGTALERAALDPGPQDGEEAAS